MNRHTIGAVIRLTLIAALLTMGPAQGVFAAESTAEPAASGAQPDRIQQYSEMMQRSYITQEQREAAANQILRTLGQIQGEVSTCL